MKDHKRGFTIIELLIVIAIIGVLAAIVAVNGTASRAKARDAQRVSDIGNIQTALEAYFEASPMGSQTYPTSTAQLVSQGYFGALPTDPTTHANYHYNPTNNGSGLYKSYCLGAKIENTSHPALKSSAGCNSGDATDNYTVSR